MSSENHYLAVIQQILDEEPRFDAEAYLFVQEAVAVATKRFSEESGEGPRHVTGQQLLEVIRDLALSKFGPLALDVLHDWGVRGTEDFGALVFTMVRHGLLGASDEDSHLDFRDGYEFRQAFLVPFQVREEPPADLPSIDD